jgi:hypothetical protein
MYSIRKASSINEILPEQAIQLQMQQFLNAKFLEFHRLVNRPGLRLPLQDCPNLKPSDHSSVKLSHVATVCRRQESFSFSLLAQRNTANPGNEMN